MNTNPDPGDPLLDAILRDENWQQTSAACKAQALEKFQAHQRTRRLTRWTGGVLATVLVLTCGLHWLILPPSQMPIPLRAVVQQVAVPSRLPNATPLQQMAKDAKATPIQSPKPEYLSDQELLAAFPAGSCFLAYVDGKKELVFLDRNVERQYLHN